MSNTSQASVPQNFYTWTSSQLLEQPRPQRIFAKWLMSALSMSLTPPDSIGLDGRAISGTGADFTKYGTAELQLAQDLPASLLAVKVDFKGQPGDTVKINRPKYATGQNNEMDDRQVKRGELLSETPIAASLEQNLLTLREFKGPWGVNDAGVAGAHPLGIERFDQQFGIHNQVQMNGLVFVDDFHGFLDYQLPKLGELGKVIYADGMAAENDPTEADQFPFSTLLLSRVQEDMDSNTADGNCPTLPDGYRPMVITPRQWRQLQHDPELKFMGERYPQYNLLFGKSYLGSYGKFHLFESSTLFTPNNSSSVPVQHAMVISPGAFMAGMGNAPKVVPHVNDNYGHQTKAMWFATLAFKLANSNFLRSVRSA